jgi:hypothetical protein
MGTLLFAAVGKAIHQHGLEACTVFDRYRDMFKHALNYLVNKSSESCQTRRKCASLLLRVLFETFFAQITFGKLHLKYWYQHKSQSTQQSEQSNLALVQWSSNYCKLSKGLEIGRCVNAVSPDIWHRNILRWTLSSTVNWLYMMNLRKQSLFKALTQKLCTPYRTHIAKHLITITVLHFIGQQRCLKRYV